MIVKHFECGTPGKQTKEYMINLFCRSENMKQYGKYFKHKYSNAIFRNTAFYTKTFSNGNTNTYIEFDRI